MQKSQEDNAPVFSFEKEADIEPESDHEEEEPPEGEPHQEAMRQEYDGLFRKYHFLEACKTGPRENPSLIAAMNKELRHMRHLDTNMKQSLNTIMLNAKIKSRASCPSRDVVVANKRANLAQKIDKHLNSNIQVFDSLMQKSAVVQHDLEMCRRKLGGENNKKEMIHQVEKKIQLLDNRLHRSQLNFSQSLTLNRKLQLSIESMAKERLMDLSIRRQLEVDLSKKRRCISKILRISEKANEERQRALMEVQDRKNSADRQVFLFEQRWLSVDSLIERENAEHCLLEAKTATRNFQELVGVDISQQKIDAIETIMRRASWTVAKDTACIRVVHRRINDLKQVFGKIQRSTGGMKLDDLVEHFTKAEMRNFDNFNEVNKLSDEIEHTRTSIGNLTEKTEDARCHIQESHTISKMLFLQETQSRVEMQEKVISEYEDSIADMESEFSDMKPTLQRLVDMFQNNPNFLFANVVGEHNILSCLNELEENILALMDLHQKEGNYADFSTCNDFNIIEGDGEARFDAVVPLPSTEDHSEDFDKQSKDTGTSAPFITAIN